MGAEHQNFEIETAESLIGWWREAGVDCAISETPFAWLGKPDIAKPAIVKPTVAALPDKIDTLSAWLMEADLPGAGPSVRRLPPTGDTSAQLMILTDFPEHDDIAAGRWMAGALETVFDGMLAALGTDRASVYLASLCPGRPVSGLIADEALPELARIARHHMALVRPKQLWLIGTAPSRAILGMSDAAAKGRLHSVNLDGVTILTIATAHPRHFEGSKSRKAAAWVEMQRLLKKDDV
jgi:uracil-DNA glycosylase